MVKRDRKGQGFSVDVLVVVLVVLFGVIFLVTNRVNKVESGPTVVEIQQKASEDSRVIYDELKARKVINQENNIEIDYLLQLDMQQLKEDLNIKGDFCIVFEKDGNLVKIDPENGINGYGSEKIIVNGVPCKSS